MSDLEEAQQALREQIARYKEKGELSFDAYLNGVVSRAASADAQADFADTRYLLDNNPIYKDSFAGDLPIDQIGGSLPPIKGDDFESWVRVMFEGEPGQGQFLLDWVDAENPVYPANPKERMAVELYDRLLSSFFTPTEKDGELGTRTYSDAVKDYTLTDTEYAKVLLGAEMNEKGIHDRDHGYLAYDETLGDWGARIVMLAGGAIQGMMNVDEVSRQAPKRHTQEELQSVMSNYGEYRALHDAIEGNGMLQWSVDLEALKQNPERLFQDSAYAESVFSEVLNSVEAVCGTPRSIPNLVAANGVKIR